MRSTPKRLAIGGAAFFVFFATIGTVFGPPEEPEVVVREVTVPGPPKIVYRDRIVEVPVEVEVPSKQTAPPPAPPARSTFPESCVTMIGLLDNLDSSSVIIGEQVGRILPVLSDATRDIVAEDFSKLNDHVTSVRDIKNTLGTQQIVLAEDQEFFAKTHAQCRQELNQ